MNTGSETRILFIMRDDGDMTEPMNIMLLSALAKQNAPWRSSHLALLERDDVMKVVDEVKPTIVAASAITGSHRAYLEALKAVKDRYNGTVLTVLGGPYCSSYPGVIAAEPYLDAIGYLECDDAWPEFIRAYEDRSDHIHEIPNMVTRENHSRVLKEFTVPDPVTGKPHKETYVDQSFYRPRKSDLDSLPFLDRNLIYKNTLFGGRMKRTHMAGRGCPHRCTYCFEHDWNEMYLGKGKILQRYSPQRYCAELQRLVHDWPTRFIKHYDDVFPVFPPDKEWLEEFADVYPRMVGLPFHCLIRCDNVVRSPWALPLLKQAGVFSLTMSIESGNAFIRDRVIARDMQGEEIEAAFRAAQKLGIRTFSNTILAIPGPKIPAIHDPQFDQKLAEVVSDSTLYYPARKRKVDMGKELEEARKGFGGDEAAWRAFAVSYLKRAGLHETQLQYDRESVTYTLDLGVSFGEFATLFPYPRTEVTTRYLIPKGYFDGDYDKLHASYQNRSPLSCFTEYEKTVQENLPLLGTVCILMTGSNHRLVRWLGWPLGRLAVYWLSAIQSPKATRIYQALYTMSKTYMHEKRVYPMHLGVREKLKFFTETWRLDVWKHFRRKVKSKPLVLRGSRPGQFLGGPPSV